MDCISAVDFDACSKARMKADLLISASEGMSVTEHSVSISSDFSPYSSMKELKNSAALSTILESVQ
jgi:hypothetical protein